LVEIRPVKSIITADFTEDEIADAEAAD